MRIFVVLGILLMTGSAYLLVDGGVRLERAVDGGAFSPEIWQAHFWLRSPADPGLGLGPNAHWFLRLGGGVVGLAVGWIILRIARR